MSPSSEPKVTQGQNSVTGSQGNNQTGQPEQVVALLSARLGMAVLGLASDCLDMNLRLGSYLILCLLGTPLTLSCLRGLGCSGNAPFIPFRNKENEQAIIGSLLRRPEFSSRGRWLNCLRLWTRRMSARVDHRIFTGPALVCTHPSPTHKYLKIKSFYF